MFIWIWQLEKQVQKYGSIEGVINKLKSLNINDVCIKYHEGSSPIGAGEDYRAAFLKYKDTFKAAGFRVGTWGYNYFNNVQAEANLIIEATRNSDYYIFDPEVDVSGKFNQAEQVCQIVRNAEPNATIGYSSFPIVSYHQDIPYSVFNRYCNFASPQAYWGEMQWSIQNCINKMLSDHKEYGLDKPIFPSLQTYKLDLASYEIFESMGFANYGAWSFDEIDNAAAQFISSNPNINLLSGPAINIVTNDNDLNSYKYLQHELNTQFKSGLTEDNVPGQLTLNACVLVKKGATGNLTRWIQAKLNIIVDGIFGEETEKAVRVFQSAHGLNPDGEVGHNTWSTLLGIAVKINYDVAYLQREVGVTADNIPGPVTLSKCPLIKKGATGNIIKWIQAKLNITADGIFGDQTFVAIQNFQASHGLVADGIIGINTWRKLLGL